MPMTPAAINSHAKLLDALFRRIVNHQIKKKTFAYGKKQIKVVK